jgi:hypothetical protein
MAVCAAPASSAASELEVGSSRLHVTLDGEPFRIGAAALVAWVRRSATIVASYYGSFPVADLTVHITAVDGGKVRNGRAEAGAGPAGHPSIQVRVGQAVPESELLSDWVLVHEMTHLALPEVGREHAWLSEGLATYIEGVARVQAGNMTPDELWLEDVRSMPKGLPGDGDEGLDRTHTWARTYWGGALFCLVADVTIRERTANRLGLQDAMRAVARDSGGMQASWPIERVLHAGDAATGTTVLTELYAQMSSRPSAPDLADLWRRLGIATDGDAVRLLAGTKEAATRESITRPPAPRLLPQ